MGIFVLHIVMRLLADDETADENGGCMRSVHFNALNERTADVGKS